MTIKKNSITKGFILAGLMNMSFLIFSRFFTNSTIPEYDGDVMSNFGLLMIIIWGISLHFRYKKVSTYEMAYCRLCTRKIYLWLCLD